jgi:hypothetical protein
MRGLRYNGFDWGLPPDKAIRKRTPRQQYRPDPKRQVMAKMQLKPLHRQLRDCTKIKQRSVSGELVNRELEKALGRKPKARAR